MDILFALITQDQVFMLFKPKYLLFCDKSTFIRPMLKERFDTRWALLGCKQSSERLIIALIIFIQEWE